MWWHTVTHRRRSKGETGEWSGYPVLITLPRNMVYPVLLPLMNTPRLPVVDWTDAPADLNKLVRFAERRNLVSERVPSHFKRSLPRNSPLKSAISKLCPKLTALVEVSPYNRLNRRTFLGYANGIKISFRGNLGFCERRSAPTVPWHCD